MKNEKLKDILLMVGLLAMLVTAMLPLFTASQDWMRWGFAAGAALVLVVRLLDTKSRGTLRERRLRWLGVLGALLYCGAAATIFYSPGTQDWVAFLLAGAVMQMYVGYMLPRAANEDK